MYFFAFVGLAYTLGMCFCAIRAAGFQRVLSKHASRLSIQKQLIRDGRSKRLHVNPLASFEMLADAFENMMRAFPTATLQAFGAPLMLLTICSVVAFLSMVCFGCDALCRASAGQTGIEFEFPMKEYVEITPKVYWPLGSDFYQQACWRNFRDILGTRWWLRLVFPTSGGPND